MGEWGKGKIAKGRSKLRRKRDGMGIRKVKSKINKVRLFIVTLRPGIAAR